MCAPAGQDGAIASAEQAGHRRPAGGRQYTTADVEPLSSVHIDALGLHTTGHADRRHPVGAPPSICINSRGSFTGFDNELLRAIADKLGLRSQLRRHRLLRAAGPGGRRGASTSARRRSSPPKHAGAPSASPTATTSATSRWSCRPVRRSHGFDDLAAGQRIGVVQGTVAGGLRRRHPAPAAGEVPRLQHRLRQPEDPPDRRLGGAGACRRPERRCSPAIPPPIVENTFSLGNFVAYAVAKDNQPLIDALNSGLDAVIADGTWAKLYTDWVPRALPPGWKPGSKAAPTPQLPDFAAIAARNHAGRRRRPPPPKSTLAQLRDSFFDWDLYQQAIPDLLTTGLPNTLILTVSCQRHRAGARHGAGGGRDLPIPLAALAGPGLHRHLPRPARGGDHPADRAGHRADRRRTDRTTIPTRWASPRWG